MVEPSWRPALVAAAVGALVTWVVCSALLAAGGTVPAVSASAWLPLVLVTVGTAWLWRAGRRAARDPRWRPDADVAVLRLRVGAASLIAGAVLAGGYAALAGFGLAGWPAPLAVDRVVHGSAAAIAAVAWSVFGALVVRAGRVPPES